MASSPFVLNDALRKTKSGLPGGAKESLQHVKKCSYLTYYSNKIFWRKIKCKNKQMIIVVDSKVLIFYILLGLSNNKKCGFRIIYTYTNY